MATGCGKTLIAFQIAWKLTQSNFLHRVLFLTDRVFLRDQAYKIFRPLKLIKRKIDLKLKLETLTKIEIFILQIINHYMQILLTKKFQKIFLI